MRFRDNFTKDFETSDDNFYDTLRTHYYRSRVDETLQAVRDTISKEGGRIIDENNTYKEILFETSGYSCTCKVTAISPVEIAVDFKVTTFNLIGFGKGKKVIERLYKLLDQKLAFKGTGLYKG